MKRIILLALLGECLLFAINGVRAQDNGNRPLSVQTANRTNTPAPAPLEEAFVHPPDEAKPWVFFWWFNGYVDREGITRHLEALKANGIGGVLLYASQSAGIPSGAPFMSPEWRSLFKYAVKETDRLGLQMGMNICNGWPSGGTWITPQYNSHTLSISAEIVRGPRKLEGELPDPALKNDDYQDIAVQAIPVSGPEDASPRMTAGSDSPDAGNLLDGNYYTRWVGQNQPGSPISPAHPQWVQFEYSQPRTIDYVWVGAEAFSTPSSTLVQASDDGIHFRDITVMPGNYLDQFSGPVTQTTARYFRLQFNGHGNNAYRVSIGDIGIGTKPEVERMMAMAAKRALNNPIGVTSTPSKTQMDFVWKELSPLPGDRPVRVDSVRDISGYCSPGGKINWNVPPGAWKILRIGSTNTRSPAGGGLLIDYMSAGASKQNDDRFLKLLIEDAGPLAGKSFKYFHEDNVEINGPYSWTPQFMEEFHRRRGYDARPYLPALAGELVESRDITDRFLQDYRRTIADLVAENHYAHISGMAGAHGIGLQAEAGGQFLPFMLCNDGLMNLGRTDIPAGEVWESTNWKENQDKPGLPPSVGEQQWKEEAQDVDAKQASSAGHIYGKKIINSETFTSLGPDAHWRLAPSDLLLYSNIAFCEGINRLTVHSSTTTMEKDGKPGYEYAAGTHFNQNVTWWKDAGPFITFLSRCSGMLQRGLFVADVLYYNGDDIPNVVGPKHIPQDLGKGYDYDVCNTEVLLSRLSVKDGRLFLPDGMSYRLMVLPEGKAFNVAALEKVKQLLEEGATIIGPRPERAMGLTDYPKSDARIRQLASEIWGKCDGAAITENQLGAGKIYWGKTAREVLAQQGITADFSYEAEAKDALVDFIHRREGAADIYYVANRRKVQVAVNCTFRVSGKQPEIWDPFTGKHVAAPAYRQQNGTTTLPLELTPYGSTFIVFRDAVPDSAQGRATGNYPRFQVQAEITGPFQVSFDTAWGGPKKVILNKLEDWSLSASDSIRYYSGTAGYSKEFKAPDWPAGGGASAGEAGKRMILDLGEVKNTAHVWLNGKDLGIVWAPPYRVDITDAVTAGNNRLKIEVTNTWVNRLIGDSKLPPEQRRTKTNIVSSSEAPLSPSGLLGPLRIGYW